MAVHPRFRNITFKGNIECKEDYVSLRDIYSFIFLHLGNSFFSHYNSIIKPVQWISHFSHLKKYLNMDNLEDVSIHTHIYPYIYMYSYFRSKYVYMAILKSKFFQ